MSSLPKEVLASVTRTVRQTLLFNRRSTARDVAYFWITVTLLGVAADEAISRLLPWDTAVTSRVAALTFLNLPFFALFARRLHDHNWSGWWVFMLPPLMAFNVYRTMQVNFAVLDPNWSPNVSHASAWGWLLLPLAIVSVGIMFLPGTIGTNRYGPDPREGSHGASAAE